MYVKYFYEPLEMFEMVQVCVTLLNFEPNVICPLNTTNQETRI